MDLLCVTRTLVLGLAAAAFAGTFAGSWIGSGTAESQTAVHIGCRFHMTQLYLLLHNVGPTLFYILK